MRVQSSCNAWTLTPESQQSGVCEQKQASSEKKEDKMWKWRVIRKTTEFRAFSWCSFRKSIPPTLSKFPCPCQYHVLPVHTSLCRQVRWRKGISQKASIKCVRRCTSLLDCSLVDSAAMSLVANFNKRLACCQWESAKLSRGSSYIVSECSPGLAALILSICKDMNRYELCVAAEMTDCEARHKTTAYISICTLHLDCPNRRVVSNPESRFWYCQLISYTG